MASNTLIQYLEETRYSALPGGSSVDVGTEVSDRRQTEIFKAGADLTIGDVVSLDVSQSTDGKIALYVVPADTDATTTVCPVGVVVGKAQDVGSSATTVESGELALVCVRGVCEALCAPCTQGDVLTITSGAGVLDTIAAATSPQVAIALETVAVQGLATVYVRGAF